MPINWEACPLYNKDKKRYKECPAPLADMCHFSHCDLSSDKTCGECVHFEGTIAASGERHKTYGHCYWTIGVVSSTYKCNCPHYFPKPDGFQFTYSEWIENELGEFAYSSDPTVRPLRKEKRLEWGKLFDK